MSVDRPADGPFIRGTTVGHGRIEYGIESYYVQESTGHDYEDAIRNPNQEVWAEIKLDKNGRATLVGLHIEPAPDAPLVAPVD